MTGVQTCASSDLASRRRLANAAHLRPYLKHLPHCDLVAVTKLRALDYFGDEVGGDVGRVWKRLVLVERKSDKGSGDLGMRQFAPLPRHHHNVPHLVAAYQRQRRLAAVADERDGALSGSTLKEASSWGKVDTVYEQMVFAEATIAFPLIAGYAYHKRNWEGRKAKNFNAMLDRQQINV